MPTQCQNTLCGEEDSFEHLIMRSGVGDPPAVQPGKIAMEEGNEEILEYLEHLAVRAHGINPGPLIPPWPREGGAEIELFSVGSGGAGSGGDGTDVDIEFENDLPS